jgi:hypothetical protein
MIFRLSDNNHNVSQIESKIFLKMEEFIGVKGCRATELFKITINSSNILVNLRNFELVITIMIAESFRF